MTRYGEEILLEECDELWENMSVYMNDEVREQVHFELCPCSREEFLRRYCELDVSFIGLLRVVFHVEL